jgi:uncharacterized Fe-S cluster-containing protein
MSGKTRNGAPYQDSLAVAEFKETAPKLPRLTVTMFKETTEKLSETTQELKDVKAELAKVEKEVPYCCVCEDEYRQSVLKPCSHFATCQNCVFKLKCCPICQEPIVSVERIFAA